MDENKDLLAQTWENYSQLHDLIYILKYWYNLVNPPNTVHTEIIITVLYAS